jgi:hypothetical protein
MKYRRLIVMLVFWLVGTAQAFESHIGAEAPVFNGPMQTCFVHAMLGMDSVISARLGVPPEHVVALALNPAAVGDALPAITEPSYDEPVLTLMLAAYLWQGSPHSYAIQVFYDCAVAAPLMAERSDFLP